MTYSSEVLTDSPAAYYRLGESSGTTMVDSSGNGRDGTFSGSPTLGVASLLTGDANTCVDFDGSNDVGTGVFGSWAAATSFTVEAVIRPDSVGNGAIIARRNVSSGDSWEFRVLSGKLNLNFIQGGSYPGYSSTAAISTATTYHVAATYDGTNVRLYINGVLDSTHAYSSGFNSTSTPLSVGSIADSGAPSAYDRFDGKIDEAAFYGFSLSGARIAAHAAAAVAVAGLSLVGAAETDASVTLGITVTSIPLAGLAAMASSDASIALRKVIATATQNLISGRDRQGEALATWEPPVVAPPETPTPAYAFMAAQAWDSVTVAGTRAELVNLITVEKPRTCYRILVAGRDLTFWRGIPTPEPTYSLIEPLLYGSGSLELPQVVVPFESPGRGALAWMKPGAPVLVQEVDTATNAVVSTNYRGFLLDPDISGRSLRWGLGGEVSGRAALQHLPSPLFKRRNDLGFWWSTAVAKAGGRFAPRGGPDTNIALYATGGTGLLDHMMELSAKGVTDGGAQFTCMPDANGVYRVARKDLETIHATAYLDDAHTVANLRRDPAEEPNRIYATGVTPAGMRVKFGVYPVLADTKPVPFPGNLDEGDSGSGVTALIVRLAATGYLSYDDRPGGFDADVTEAVKDLQDQADLPKTGIVDADTWAALFDVTISGYDIGGSHIEPAAQRSYTRRYKRTAGGNVFANNPNFDRHRLLVDRSVDFGTGHARSRMTRWAKRLLAPDDANNWAGTIVFNTHALIDGQHNPGDALTAADILPAKDLEPGMNLWLPTWDGGTLIHVSGVDIGTEGIVTATVDTQARDTMTVWEVLARNAENRRDPGRAWIRRHRSSGMDKDAVGEFDEIGGVISETPLQAGWNVIPVIAGQSGTIGRLRIRLNPAKEFTGAVFGRKVTRGYLAARVPMPLSKVGGKRWNNEGVRDELDAEKVSLYVAGDLEGPAGYSPLIKDSETESGDPAPLTGRLDDDAGFEYRTFAAPRADGGDPAATYVLWLAIWVDSATTLQGGRVMWPLMEAGS